jgi:FtsH-binding integral membrane protein
MSQYPQQQPWQPARPHELDYGRDTRVVASFFNIVYAWMAVGLALTGVVAWLVSQNDQLMSLVYASRGTYVLLGLGAFGIAMLVQMAAHRMSPSAALGLFLLYAALIGALIAGIFKIYPTPTIFGAFLMTGGVFGGLSVYGFITKRDLSGMGSILIMCVWGLILASIVNIFLASSLFSWIITYAVLAVFIGLTAYDTQRLKEIAYATQGDPVAARRYAIVGSLHLYVDFINIFLSILRIMGDRR